MTFFSFSTLEILSCFFCFWYIVSDNSLFLCIYCLFVFFLAAFKSVSSHWFSAIDHKVLWCFLFVYPTWGSWSSLDLWQYSFHQIWKYLRHCFFKYCPLSGVLQLSLYWSESEGCSVMSNSVTPRTIHHGILQARILEWVAFPFCRGSS